MRTELINLIFFVIFFAVGCNTSNETLIPTYVAETAAAREAASALVERALAEVLTGTASVPTITPTLTLTPAPTDTLTPTPPPMATVIRENSPVFAGPAVYYDLVVKLSFGYQVEVLGISENEAWLWVQLADGTQGWIATELVELQGKITQFAVVEAPPTPMPPPSVQIIVANGFPESTNIVVKFQILDLGLSYNIKPGRSISIVIPGGYHDIVFSLRDSNALYCEKQVYIRSDTYVEISYNVYGCGAFR